MNQIKTRPTVTSLARNLNVSRQTISNAIHHPERLQPDTLAKIQAEIKRQGYVPSTVARQLRSQRTNVFSYRLHPVFEGINGNILDRFLHSLVETVEESGYSILVFAAEDDEDEVRHIIALHKRGVIDGAILTSSTDRDRRPRQLFEAEVPAVVFGRPWNDPDSPVSWVDVDGKAGTRQATTILRQAGHERIGWIGWLPEVGVGYDRHMGYIEAMGEHHDTTMEIAVPDSTEAGRRAAEELIHRGATALVCASDSLALGAVTSGTIELSNVFGFDDTPVARAMNLNSVAQPIEDTAHGAFIVLHRNLGSAQQASGQLMEAVPVVRTTPYMKGNPQ